MLVGEYIWAWGKGTSLSRPYSRVSGILGKSSRNHLFLLPDQRSNAISLLEEYELKEGLLVNEVGFIGL